MVETFPVSVYDRVALFSLLKASVAKEETQRFRDDPEYYLKFRKDIENKINSSFRHNIKDHIWQKMEREVCLKKIRIFVQY